MNVHHPSTIAAVATPAGHGAVGVIRVSGPLGPDVLHKLFTSSRPDFVRCRPYRLHHGHLFDGSGRVLDEVLICHMPGPGSFTGEDVMEINCHGSPVILQSILESLQSHGIRAAAPGEFTQRAFLNGRMDLTQAEAVAEIINAVTPTAALLAQAKLAGGLRQRIQTLRGNLENLRAQLCLAVDFPEEDVECLAPGDFLLALGMVGESLRELLANRETNRIWEQGALCVLTGPVNAGKSSLLNAFLGRKRAIVSDIPGTTRDYIEATITLGGLTIRLVDTAGIRQSDDVVELAGLAAGHEMRTEADLVLLVLDGSLPFTDHEPPALDKFISEQTLVVLNKADLALAEPDPAEYFTSRGFEVLRISVKTDQGLDMLRERIRVRLTAQAPAPSVDTLAPNLRQSAALQQALSEIKALIRDIRARIPYDVLGVRLESICSILAEITGEITSENVLRDIFSRFCIGK